MITQQLQPQQGCVTRVMIEDRRVLEEKRFTYSITPMLPVNVNVIIIIYV